MRARNPLLPVLAVVLVLPVVALAATETSHTEKSFDAIPGGTVVVDTSFHRVEVKVEPGGTVHAVVDLEFSASESKARRLIEAYTPRFSVEGDRIVIRSKSNKSSFGSVKNKGTVEVTMPPGMNLEVDGSSGSCTVEGDLGEGAVSIDLSSGSTKVRGAMSELVVDASSGSVDVRLLRSAERVRIDLSSGGVELDGPTPDLRVGTSSGSIRAKRLTGDAKLDASSGSITAGWTEIPAGARVTADTSSGGVRLSFPQGTALSGVVDTSSGGIHSDFPGELSKRRNHMVLDSGAGAVEVRVETSSGGVKLIEE